MFDTWQNFYLLMGPSAAALIGWLFVVATLTQNSTNHAQTAHGMRVYSTPIVFHLSAIVLAAALALMPHTPVAVIAGAVSATAGAGLVYCVYVGREMRTGKIVGHWADFWSYAVAVAIAYAVQLAAGIGLMQGWPAATWMLAGSFLAQLMIAIYNAWDLVTWIAPRANTRNWTATD
jgi:hypothetical protein